MSSDFVESVTGPRCKRMLPFLADQVGENLLKRAYETTEPEKIPKPYISKRGVTILLNEFLSVEEDSAGASSSSEPPAKKRRVSKTNGNRVQIKISEGTARKKLKNFPFLPSRIEMHDLLSNSEYSKHLTVFEVRDYLVIVLHDKLKDLEGYPDFYNAALLHYFYGPKYNSTFEKMRTVLQKHNIGNNMIGVFFDDQVRSVMLALYLLATIMAPNKYF
jgi:hypothetical protein